MTELAHLSWSFYVAWDTYAPDTSEPLVFGSRLKDLHVKAMANAMGRRRNAGQTSADDSNPLPGEV